MRLLLVSTPRSGNMWTRRLVRALYDLEERSVHDADELEWESLPERCVVQLHADRSPALESRLAAVGVRTVVLARHPLDVLLSILHFARHEPQTACWLGGRGGDERTILDAGPTSRAFLRYATGPRATALLAVTPQWWPVADVRLRYEELVARPRETLAGVVATLGEEPALPIDQVLERVNFTGLRSEAANQHFWQGRPGGWQRLLTPRTAGRIEDAHRDVFELLGYSVEHPSRTSRRRARAHWNELLVQPR